MVSYKNELRVFDINRVGMAALGPTAATTTSASRTISFHGG